jgi:hypothetical protein
MEREGEDAVVAAKMSAAPSPVDVEVEHQDLPP